MTQETEHPIKGESRSCHNCGVFFCIWEDVCFDEVVGEDVCSGCLEMFELLEELDAQKKEEVTDDQQKEDS